MNFLVSTFTFIYCSLIGSFLNVVIYRLPKNQDIIFQRSSCPKCGHKIRWYELIPIISFLFLFTRCSQCKTKISWRYPLTELIIGIMGVYLAPSHWNFDNSIIFLFYFSIFCIFMCHFQIDLAHKILPDSLNIILFSLFLSYSVLHFSVFHWLLGGAIGLLFPLLVTWIFYLLRGQIGLGGGDIKLYGILGLFLGPELILRNIFLSCFLGAIVAGFLIFIKKLKKENPIPFGPFILVVAAIQIYFPEILNYLNLMN